MSVSSSPNRGPTLDPRSRVSGVLARVCGGLVGAAAAALVAALFDANWARWGSAEAPGLAPVWVATAGLLAPLAVGVGTAVGLGSLVLHPHAPPSLARLLRTLEVGDKHDRARLAIVAPASALAAAVWLVVVGDAALQVLVSPLAVRPAGVAIGLAAVGWASLLGLAVLALGSVLGPRWGRHLPGPLVTGSLGVAGALVIMGVGIGFGDVGGTGGPLFMFGVLGREELDLRAPTMVAAIAAAAYLAPAATRRLPWWALGTLGLAPLLLTWHVAGAGLADRRTNLVVERSAPASRVMVRLLRRMSDHDGDGVSAWFGGGDCDDGNARIFPGANDVPENGLDEDCSGADAAKVAIEAPKPKAPPDARTFIRQRIPQDLSVVVLSIDALRWDATGFMGYQRNTTPNLDKLADRGVVFDAAYAPASYTGKSIPPMMVGKYGSELHRGWAHFNRIDERDRLVWERLHSEGVRTLSVQGYWYFFRKGIGFERGWDVLDGSAASGMGYTEKDESVTSDKIADKTIEILGDSANTGKRFFFWTHYVDPHADYIRHEEFDFGRSGRDRYDSEVAFTDHHVGRVIDFISSGDLADRTAIVITADHGEAFGEHGMIRHGFEVWEPLVRVPLVIYVPGVEPHRVKSRRGLVDLVPTVLDLYGLPLPDGKGDDFVSGQSLTSDIFLPPGYKPAERIVFVDMQAGPNNDEKQAFYTGDLKLITTYGKPDGLYDLSKDPAEAEDLLDSDPAQRERIVSRYQAFRRGLRQVWVQPVPK